MSFSDFKKEFDDMEICNVTLDSFDETEDGKSYLHTFHYVSLDLEINATFN